MAQPKLLIKTIYPNGTITFSPVPEPRIKWRQTFVVEGSMAVCECGWRQELALQRQWCPKCGVATMVSEERGGNG